MNPSLIPSLLALAAAGVLTLPAGARAETRACTPVTAVPVVLELSGVYCLNQDLATAITSGTAIRIDDSNITLDCNGYKLGGLAAGAASQTVGISTFGTVHNVTIRNCSVRGFRTGILLSGDASRVEANRLDGNLQQGIRVEGQGAVITGNRVFDTGNGADSSGIVLVGSGLVTDNTVTGVDGAANAGDGDASGLSLGGGGPMLLERNRVRGVVAAPSPALASGLRITGDTMLSMKENWFVGGLANDAGIRCDQAITAATSGGTIAGFTTTHSGCGPDLP